mgnify:CR=1 FL=1|jgi:thioredoxin-like negative regulator of GroEL
MSEVIELNDTNFNDFVLAEDQYVFIDFYSPSCAPCQALLEMLPSLAKHYHDKPITIAKADVAQNPLIQNKYQITSVPLVLLIDKSKQVDKAIGGLNSPDVYINGIDKMLLKKEKKQEGLFASFKKWFN